MTDDTAQGLCTAASAAHDRGDIGEATALFRKVLELHPYSNEAADAVYYLTSGHRRPAQRVESDNRDAAVTSTGTQSG
jgi:hypothetical protein